MAALLHARPSLLPSLNLPFLRPSWSILASPSSSSNRICTSESSIVRSAGSLSSSPWTFSLPSWRDVLEDLFPAILRAVPKSKISHSRKSMRSANKGLKNKTNFAHCEACGSIKLSHNVCPSCYSQISRQWKREAREAMGSGEIGGPRGSPSVEP